MPIKYRYYIMWSYGPEAWHCFWGLNGISYYSAYSAIPFEYDIAVLEKMYAD